MKGRTVEWRQKEEKMSTGIVFFYEFVRSSGTEQNDQHLWVYWISATLCYAYIFSSLVDINWCLCFLCPHDQTRSDQSRLLVFVFATATQCTFTDMEIWVVHKLAFPFGQSIWGVGRIVCATRLCLGIGIFIGWDFLQRSTISLSLLFTLTKTTRQSVPPGKGAVIFPFLSSDQYSFKAAWKK